MNKFLLFVSRIFKIEEKVKNLIRYGVIKEIDVANNLVTVEFGDKLESPKIPYFVNNSGNATVYFTPKVGDQVMIFSPNGNINNGVAMPSIYKGNISGAEDEWRLEFAKGAITYKEGKLEVKSDSEISLNSKKVMLVGEDGGGVVCQNNLCSFTGVTHPEGSTKVFGGK